MPDRLDPYPKSKTLAERAAWDYVAGTGLELVSINPGLVLGPLLRPQANVSTELVRLLLARGVPAVPRLAFCVVDVREVAAIHRASMLAPQAAGQRYIAAGEHLWLGDIGAHAARRVRPPQIPRPHPADALLGDVDGGPLRPHPCAPGSGSSASRPPSAHGKPRPSSAGPPARRGSPSSTRPRA